MTHRILVPLDGSRLAEAALDHASAFARAFGAEVVVLRVIEDGRDGDSRPSPSAPEGRNEAVRYVDRVLEGLWEAGLPATGEVVGGGPATAILDHAWKREVDLVLLSTHGEGGLGPFPIGGTAFKIVLRADRSVYLVPPSAPPRNARPTSGFYRTILVPLDGSVRADAAVSIGASLAAEHGARLVLANVVSAPDMARRGSPTPDDQRLAAELLRRNRAEAERHLTSLEARLERSGLEVETEVLEARRIVPAIRQVAHARNADLLLLTAHGFAASTEWCYGAVAGKLILQGGCPVLVHQDAPVRPQREGGRSAAAAGTAGARRPVW